MARNHTTTIPLGYPRRRRFNEVQARLAREAAEATDRERKRAAAEKRAAEQEAEWRKADEEHRTAFDREIVEALRLEVLGVGHRTALSIVAAIIEGKIPHVSITY